MDTDKTSCNEGDSNLIMPIHRIPPEVWECIFENLEDSRDVLSVSRANQYWMDIVYSTKQAWLFDQIFPLLLKYISKVDVHHCRRVCKRWLYAVSHFLEQSPFHRPASAEERDRLEEETTNHYKTDDRLRPLITDFHQKQLLYNKFVKVENMVALLNDQASTPASHNPFIGRSVVIAEGPVIRIPSNIIFLEQFGKHIWFLNVCFVSLTPVQVVKRLLSMLQHVPNLKKLDLRCSNSLPHVSPSEMLADQKKLLADYMNYEFTDEMRERLPRLETLDVETTMSCHSQFKQILLSLFFNDDLESLAMDHMPVLPTKNCKSSRLVDLAMSLANDGDDDKWAIFNQLNCPLRRLMIIMWNNVCWIHLIDAVNKYQSSLRNLGLEFSVHDSGRCQTFWHNMGTLKLPHLLRLSLKGYLPPSLNFITELKSTKYLHLRMRTGREEIKNPVQRPKNHHEVLDLVTKYLCDISNYGNVKPRFVYESNVWLVFPRLKVLTLVSDTESSQQNGMGWEFTREIYEKNLQSCKTSQR